MARRLALAALLASLAACAGREEGPAIDHPRAAPPSHTTALNPADATAVAQGIASLVSENTPAGRMAGTLAVQPAPDDATLLPALHQALGQAGYRIAAPDDQRPQHTLAYRVSPLDSDVLARATLDGTGHLSRLFRRNRAGLQPAGASVMTTEAAQ